tara:strand:+ start:481 stop:792 length:312 start_codon:yes stop_codon:yes gene_type:complete
MNYEEIDRISDQIVALLEGTDASALAMVARKLEIGAITRYEVYKEDQLLCDPIIWLEEDLEDCTMEQWCSTRAYKTLNERSIEEGHETRQILEQWAIQGDDDE